MLERSEYRDNIHAGTQSFTKGSARKQNTLSRGSMSKVVLLG